MKGIFIPVIIAAALVSCGTPGPGKAGGGLGGTAPLWVSDTGALYPREEWLCAAGSGPDKGAAEAAALGTLARTFRVNLRSETQAYEHIAQYFRQSGGKRIEISETSRKLLDELTAKSNITGLIGVETEFWTAPDRQVYANARMNRPVCAARYASMIDENERIIGILLKEAEQKPGSFEAYADLSFAAALAEVTDNFYLLRGVLDSRFGSQRLGYGGADEIKRLARNAGQSIIIMVQVEGDVQGRIAQKFGAYFTGKGFRKEAENRASRPSYTLRAKYYAETEEDARWKYARYGFQVSIAGAGGAEVFAWSEEDRQGHTTEAGARERAAAAVEKSIESGEFAAAFDKFLDSLRGR